MPKFFLLVSANENTIKKSARMNSVLHPPDEKPRQKRAHTFASFHASPTIKLAKTAIKNIHISSTLSTESIPSSSLSQLGLLLLTPAINHDRIVCKILQSHLDWIVSISRSLPIRFLHQVSLATWIISFWLELFSPYIKRLLLASGIALLSSSIAAPCKRPLTFRTLWYRPSIGQNRFKKTLQPDPW